MGQQNESLVVREALKVRDEGTPHNQQGGIYNDGGTYSDGYGDAGYGDYGDA